MPIPDIRVVILGVDKFSKVMGGSMKKLDKIGKGMQNVGRKMSMFVTLPILGAGIAASKFSIDFNAALADVATLIPNTGDRIYELKKDIEDLSIITGKSAVGMTKGMYDVISAFEDSAETAELLRINALAAVAGVTEVKTAVDLTSAVTKAYGDITAKAVQYTSDLAFTTVRLGKTTFPELAESMSKTTAISETLGVSQKELFAIYATVAGVTGKTAKAATGLKAAEFALMKPTPMLTKLYKGLKVASGKAMVEQFGLVGSFQMIAKQAKYTGIPITEFVGRSEALITMLSLAGKGSDEFTRKFGEMENASGATMTAFKAQTEGVNKLGHRLNVTRQRALKMARSFGEILAPVLDRLLDFVEPLLIKFTEMSPKMKKMIITIAGITAAVGPVLMVLGSLLMVVGAIGTKIAAAGGIIALLSNPIGWVITGILAFIAMITYMTTHSESKLTKLLTYFFPLAGVVTWIITRWKRILPFFKLLFWALGVVFKKFVTIIKPILQPFIDLFSWIGDMVFKTLDFLLSKLEQLARLKLPEWLQKKIGLTMEGGELTAGEIAGEAGGVYKSEIKNVIKFENPPKGMEVIEIGGETEFEIDTGRLAVGVATD